MRARLATLAQAFKREFAVYRCALAHPDTPWPAKVLLGLAVGYALLPFDLIPDFLPVIGQLDDLVIVPGLVWLALWLVPPAVMAQCRARNPRFEQAADTST
ncbi:MAG: YkvA family protein [Immundisolibacter sp.]|uniref:YkvA family protein n=1 Tax=Immundisolibacter sp. TaxID=1934948 RepID=UPI003EE05D19